MNRKFKHGQVLIGFRVSKTAFPENGLHKFYLEARRLVMTDAMIDVEAYLNNSSADYYQQKAAITKRETGTRFYARSGHIDGGEFHLVWQSNSDTPDVWYGPHVDRADTDEWALKTMTKVIARAKQISEEATDHPDPFMRCFRPVDVVNAIEALGGFRMRYHRDLGEFLPDLEPQDRPELPAPKDEPAATPATAAA